MWGSEVSEWGCGGAKTRYSGCGGWGMGMTNDVMTIYIYISYIQLPYNFVYLSLMITFAR